MQESRRETRAASGYWALQTVEVWALTRDAVSVVSGRRAAAAEQTQW